MRARRLDDRGGEHAPQPLAAMLRAHVEALHLGIAVEERAQRHAAGGLATAERQDEAPARRRVVAGKGGELGVEALEAKAHAQPALVLGEEVAAGGDVGGGDGFAQLEARPGPSRGSSRT